MQSNTPPAGWKSPTIICSASVGILVMVSLWIPVAYDRRGGIRRPIDMMQTVTDGSLGQNLIQLAVFFSFTNAAWIAGALLLTAMTGRSQIWKIGFALQLGASCLFLAILVLHSLVVAWYPRELAETVAGLLPIVAIPSLWIGWAIRENRLADAWARLQHIWTALAFVFLHLGLLFSEARLFGYAFYLAVLLGVVISVEIAKNRMAHDLWDRTAPVGRSTFSIATLLGWTTVIALIYAYYQSLNSVISWLFGSE